jgi:hypothetical protein
LAEKSISCLASYDTTELGNCPNQLTSTLTIGNPQREHTKAEPKMVGGDRADLTVLK